MSAPAQAQQPLLVDVCVDDLPALPSFVIDIVRVANDLDAFEAIKARRDEVAVQVSALCRIRSLMMRAAQVSST